ncbi:MAG: hypothetical protein JRG91_13535 [Deltaproteobacteria bacterium]|nr:hypothetical protein [Deltaproteobacteria bacterium]
MRSRPISLLLLVLVTASCGSSKKDGDDVNQVPPGTDPTSRLRVVATTPASPQTGDVTIEYFLIDVRVPPQAGDVQVTYSLDGAPFVSATAGPGGEGTTELTSATRPGTAHSFVWDTMTDLGLGIHSVRVKFAPFDTGTTEPGITDRTDPFEVVNAQASAAADLLIMDPKLGGDPSMDFTYRMDPEGVDFSMTVSVHDGDSGAEVRRLVDGTVQAGGTDHTASWDGHDASGEFVATGEYELRFSGSLGALPALTASDTVYIVRLGVAAVEFVSGATGSDEYQLMYHIRNSVKYTYYPIPDDRPQFAIGPEPGEEADLDRYDGRPRSLPNPWTDLNSPPQDSSDTMGVEDDSYNLPVAYHRAATPRLRVTLGTGGVNAAGSSMGCGYPIAGLPIRLLVSGADPSTAGVNEDVSPGGTIGFDAAAALPDGVSKSMLRYTYTFEYQDAGSWIAIPGSLATEHTVYTLHGEPTLSRSSTATAPYIAWVKAVDLVAGWVDGPATEGDITGSVTAAVNSFFGLQYDTSRGACHYTTGNVDNHTMQMSDFIEDYDAGSFTVVNCSDCACLQTTFANMVGVDHEYEILGLTDRIELNYMIPIGRSWMVPFAGSFRYHAVSTNDVGGSISDACAELDDDSDPRNPPHTAILPVDMTYATYKQKLSWDPTGWGTYARERAWIH